PRTRDTVPNVGLVAQKAEEYGSHDESFEIAEEAVERVLDAGGNTLIGHAVEAGGICLRCQDKDAPVTGWVRLAVNRAKASGMPAVFWLDEQRAHDRELMQTVRRDLEKLDTQEVDIRILAPVEAALFTMRRMKEGLDTISVSGNVLRDY